MITILLIFILGYLLIIFEQYTKLDKAVPALLMGAISWLLLFNNISILDSESIYVELSKHLSSISEILLFLIGAMTIVELIDAHKGFIIIQKSIQTKSKIKLFILICLVTFFLSSVLDNLTSTIIMCSIIRKLITDKNDRLYFMGFTIIAANAGGAWSPIGDVTTTMLWMAKKISSERLILSTFLPSLLSILLPMVLVIFFVPEFRKNVEIISETNEEQILGSSKYMLVIGVLAFLSVPLLKTFAGIPPYLAMILALGLVWMISEYIDRKLYPHRFELKKELSIRTALSKIEMPSILFFLGILLSVAALETVGYLHNLADSLNSFTQNLNLVAIGLGILSALIDNVPLVAASIGMYDLPMDDHFWLMLSYCAGTGGSILVIGSAAGVAVMGIEQIDFLQYFKKISFFAFIGYLTGCAYVYFIC
ncbi:MAG: sodium:proton antiporter NhaD [Saprospiraceae bacterium]